MVLQFATKNSATVMSSLSSGSGFGYAFSIDVDDLFYSVPHNEFLYVGECIDGNGCTNFMNSCGLSIDHFLSLLEFYLSSTFVSFSDSLYV